MHFRVHITKPPDGLWAGEYPNGSYTGLLGMLQRFLEDSIIFNCVKNVGQDETIFSSHTYQLAYSMNS